MWDFIPHLSSFIPRITIQTASTGFLHGLIHLVNTLLSGRYPRSHNYGSEFSPYTNGRSIPERPFVYIVLPGRPYLSRIIFRVSENPPNRRR